MLEFIIYEYWKCKNKETVIDDWIIRWCKIDWIPMCPMIINKLLQRKQCLFSNIICICNIYWQ